MKRAFRAAWVFSLALAGSALAARPLVMDDAEPVDRGHFQVQAGVLYGDADPVTSRYETPLSLGYGLLPNLEVNVGLNYLLEKRQEEDGDKDADSVGDVAPGAKWKFLDQEKYGLDQTLSLGLTVPTASRARGLGTGKTDYSATWIVTRQVTDVLAVDANVSYVWTGRSDSESSDLLRYGAAVRYQMTKTLEPVVEIYADHPTSGGGETAVIVNGGLRWSVSEQVVLDGAVGTGVRGDAPNLLATVGLTWNF